MSLKFKEAFMRWLFQRRKLPARNIREKPTSLRPNNPPQGQSLKSRVKKVLNKSSRIKKVEDDTFRYDLAIIKKGQIHKRFPLHVRSFKVIKNFQEWPIPTLIIESIIMSTKELYKIEMILEEELRDET